MTAFLCPACWQVVPPATRTCPHCGANVETLDARPFREKLLGALNHPDRDTVVRAALALVRRHDPDSVQAIDASIRRFAHEPHVIVGLLDALMYIDDPTVFGVAMDALNHPSFMVRRTAAQVLDHLRKKGIDSLCPHGGH